MTKREWSTWLERFNAELIDRVDLNRPDAFRHPAVSAQRVASGWLGEAGLDETELERLEMRLGVVLPPSYRSFLAASNGFLLPGLVVPRLMGGAEVAWFRDVDPAAVAIWAESAAPGSPESRLGDCLLVSERELIGTGVFLLDPAARHADGEWEALCFAHWIPGANRYRDFADLLARERDGFLQQRETAQHVADLRAKRISPVRELWRILRRLPPD
jgi:hypothetical protein